MEQKFMKCNVCLKARKLELWITATKEDFEDYTPENPDWMGPWICPECKEVNYLDERKDIPKAIQLVPIFEKSELDKLDELKKRKSEIEKEEKAISSKLKDFMIKNQMIDFPLHGHTMEITYQNRSTMDEDKLVQLLINKFGIQDLKQMNALKYVSNPEIITDLVREGKLTMEELGTCQIHNLIPVFNFNKKSKSSKNDDNPFGGGKL